MLWPKFPNFANRITQKEISISSFFLRDKKKTLKNIQQLPFMWWTFHQSMITWEKDNIFLVFQKNPHACPCLNVHCIRCPKQNCYITFQPTILQKVVDPVFKPSLRQLEPLLQFWQNSPDHIRSVNFFTWTMFVLGISKPK